MSWLGEFFAALPDVFIALWTFGEGIKGLLITVGSIALTAALLFAAKQLRAEHEWLSAIAGSSAAVIGIWWLFGIIPSAWVYFADGQRELLEDTIIPSTLPLATNFYQVFRDLVVVAQQGIAIAAFTVIAFAVQKRYPKALVESEEARPQSGGYK